MNNDTELVGRGRRLSAGVCDILAVTGLGFLAIWPLGLFEQENAYEPSQLALRLILLLVTSYLVLNVWLLAKHGQTLGKRLLGIRIAANTDGQKPVLWRLLARAVSVFVITAIPLWGLLLLIVDSLFIFGPQRRCLHDFLLGTSVQRVKAKAD
ncbi:MAG: putative RDD family membrane protein YckC [Paraglaciecola psychrophila]|jgi:uncharacterized RDD family membrane protein YckC